MIKMKKSQIISVLLIFVMIISFFNTGRIARVNADEVSVSIAVSSSSVRKGDAVTATVMVSGSSLVAYTLYVTYDSGVLQFDSGSGYVGGGSGTLTISGEGSGSTSLNFTAIANGSAGIYTSGSEFYDMNMNELSVSHAGVTVIVETADTEATTKKDEKTTTDKDKTTTEAPTQSNQNTEKEENTKSKNASLSSLEVSPGTLVPEFSADTIYYTVDVEEDVEKLVISALTEDAKATTQVSGADRLSKGVNSARVTVTAENGAVKVYYITINCGTVESTKTVQIKEKLYTIMETDFPDAPNGFSQGAASYNGNDIPAYVNASGNVKIVALIDSDENAGWFVYDEEDGSFAKYFEYSPFARYIFLSVPKSVTLPEGYEKTEADLGNGKVTVYENPKNPGFYIVYAVNVDGGAGLYFYDQVERSFMRYELKNGIEAELESEKPEEEVIQIVTTESTPADILAQEPAPDEGIFTRKNLITMLIGTLALFLIMAIVAIAFIIKNVNLMHKLDEAESDAEKELADEEEHRREIAARTEVTDDTIGIQLEDVIDNNSAVQVAKEAESNISRAMEERPYGIDSAFEVTAASETAEEEASQEETEETEEPVIDEETSEEATAEDIAVEETDSVPAETEEVVVEDTPTTELKAPEVLVVRKPAVPEREPEKVALPKQFDEDDED